MNLKRLFGVLFITIMLLSMPCAYETDDFSDNSEFIFKDVNTIGNDFIFSVITECSGILSLYKSNLMKSPDSSNGKSQVLQEIRKREHYEKPTVKRKKKAEAARKRKY